jgi:hypothetical protein
LHRPENHEAGLDASDREEAERLGDALVLPDRIELISQSHLTLILLNCSAR